MSKRGGGAARGVRELPDLRGASTEGRYRIHVVAELTGIAAATLRAWERRYGFPSPARTETAYRLYSDRDVALLRAMHRHCEDGVAPSEAARLLKGLDEPQEPAPAASERDAFGAATAKIVDAVVRFDPEGLDTAIANAFTLGPAAKVYERVLAPAQVEIGELWHAGTISVGHEHMSSEALSCAVRAVLRLVQPPTAERTVLLACFADEEHVLPLYGVAFRFSAWGHRVVPLGGRTPPAALSAARTALEPDFIGLSVTIPPSGEAASRLVKQYASACGPTPWGVGGRGARALASAVEAAGGVVLDGALEASRGRFERLMAGPRR